ncbi:ATP-binding protein [Candidatus Woesearchaeota archaeon]|jgi:hypothetical protein|nr:ATP-binding protein [Candidatus Woesearchaeota archaeon]
MIRSNAVFTPSTPAKLTFVERDSVNIQIVNALSTPGKQLVIYGHSGCGKTTLIINKLNQIYEDHITVRCISSLTYGEIILQAFDELNPYYNESNTSTAKNSLSMKLKADYKLIKAEIGKSSSNAEEETYRRVIPPTLTMQTLARLLGNAKCCLVLEDFHKIQEEEKVQLAQTMKLFMDMAEEFSDLKIICIGAVGTGREVVQYDPELSNRVAEVHVPLMNDKEIRQIIEKGFPLLNIEIPSFLIERIIKLANGVPSVCHSICLHICFTLNRQVAEDDVIIVTEEILKNALDAYVNDLSDTIQSDFEKALEQRKGKYKNAQLIFKALSEFDISGAEHNDLLNKIHIYESNYPSGNLSTYLNTLTTNDKGVLLL